MVAAKPQAVFVSVDTEGCTSLVHWDEVRPTASPEYERARRIMTGETNAVLGGLYSAGASDVVVNDSHSSMRNLIAGDVDPRATIISGRLKPQFMLEGIDPHFDAACFVGYHGAVGDSCAVMAHTYSPRVIYECRLNGKPVGEVTINAALAGQYGVGIALVSGDRATLAEAKANLPWAIRVQTKDSLSYYAADSLSPAKARDVLRAAAQAALKGSARCKPLKLRSPITMEIDTLKTSQADVLEWIPGIARRAARTVAFSADDMAGIYRALTAIIYLGAAA